MNEQRVYGVLVTLDDAKDAFGKAGFGQQLCQQQRGRRIAVARLEDERVAAGQSDREHPHRHHRREVEWRDSSDNAERLAVTGRINAGRNLLAGLTLHQVGDAASELDNFEAALHFAAGVVESLAVLRGDDRCELVGASEEQLAEGEHHGVALGQRCSAPGWEGGAGCEYGAVHVGLVGERYLALDGAGRWVEDVTEAVRSSRIGLASDPMAYDWKLRSSHRLDRYHALALPWALNTLR